MKVNYATPLAEQLARALEDARRHNRRIASIELTKAEYDDLRRELGFLLMRPSDGSVASIYGVPIKVTE